MLTYHIMRVVFFLFQIMMNVIAVLVFTAGPVSTNCLVINACVLQNVPERTVKDVSTSTAALTAEYSCINS